MAEKIWLFFMGGITFLVLLAVYFYIQDKIDEYEGMKERIQELEERLDEIDENS